MNWPTWDQIKGVAERLVTIALASLLSYAVLKGWITKEAAISYGADWGPIILAALSAWYGWRINRPKAIVQSAAALPNTVVVTTSDLAKSTPEPNIVSTGDKTEEEITAQLNRDQLRS